MHELLQLVPNPINAAIIIIQHLHRDHRSLAAKLLQKHTLIPVIAVTDGLKIRQNCIYVLPENTMMTYKDGHLWLRKRTPTEKVNRAIDII